MSNGIISNRIEPRIELQGNGSTTVGGKWKRNETNVETLLILSIANCTIIATTATRYIPSTCFVMYQHWMGYVLCTMCIVLRCRALDQHQKNRNSSRVVDMLFFSPLAKMAKYHMVSQFSSFVFDINSSNRNLENQWRNLFPFGICTYEIE